MFQLLVDSSNTLWMTSNHGVSSAPLDDIIDTASGRLKKLSVKFYNRNDGLDSDGPTSTAKSLVDRYGRVWFAMVDGIAIYDSRHSYESRVMPLVQIQSVSVDNVVVLDNSLYTFEPPSIVLAPGTKRVDIAFTGLSFDAPERIHFTHKLTNFEDDFSAPATSRTMSYTNLSPGTHTFFVNAINGDGFYSDSAEAVLFVQKPYIYQMPVFWIVIVILFLGSLFLIFYIKQRRIMNENVRLEKMVAQRTSELEEAKEKSDYLLRAILPDPIADELKNGVHSIGQNFDDVTILFSDIVEFTKMSSGHTPEEIVDALNDLFSLFDLRAQRSGVEKIKTIGDAYMATCGLPTPNKNHAKIMVDFAKGMLEDLEKYNRTAKIQFALRIGLNSGSAIAGVIGRTKFIYDVWGDSVNVASRMETAATPGGIRVSENVYIRLKDSDVKFSEPIECDIKGKGRMVTYDVL
jgi:class 3 adenylate cyclase